MSRSFQGYLISRVSRGQFVHAPSQWETTLQCNVVSHWLGAYTEWSLTVKQHIRDFKQPATRPFVQQFCIADNKENTKALHYSPFGKGSHRCQVDSPHKGPIIRKALPCRDIFMSPNDFLCKQFLWKIACVALSCMCKKFSDLVNASTKKFLQHIWK